MVDDAHHAPEIEVKTPHLNTSEHKKVGWMELFYDLVYVATIVQLGNRLSDEVSVDGFISFALLFIPIWWVWIGFTLYNSRFNADDLIHRVLVFLQIGTVAALAVAVHDGFGESSTGFAIAYALARILLVIMYWRTERYVPEAKPLVHRYVIGFSIGAVVWLVSAFVPPPLRFILWIAGLLIEFATPLSAGSIRLQRVLPPGTHHLPERMGLFTIIVFGETFLKVIGGYSSHEVVWSSVLVGVLGLIVVGGLWWLYNETIAERGVQWAKRGVPVYIYGHLPLHLGLIALAVGIYELVIQHGHELADKYRLLVAGAVAVIFVAQGIIEFWTDRGNRRLDLILRLVGAGVALVIGLFGTGMNEVMVIVALALIVLVLAIVDLRDENRPDESAQSVAIEL